MPLWRYVKITSLPYIVWLPCRSLACLIWAFPISWLPIRTLTRLVWVPFMPSRRLSGPGPRWLLPSGWVPLLVSIFLNLLLPGFVPGFKLRQWPSTVILKGNSRIVTRIGVCQDRSVGRTRDLCSEAQRLVRIDELRGLEVQSSDCQYFLIWTALPSCFSKHNFTTLGYEFLQSLLIILGPDGFPERKCHACW